MAEEEEQQEEYPIRPEFPSGRVRKIMKLDPEIAKVNAEALFVVSRSVELFLAFLAERSAAIAAKKKRRTVKLDHIVAAVKNHRPTADFLLDSLPVAGPTIGDPTTTVRSARPRSSAEKSVPSGMRRIDEFFPKPTVIEAEGVLEAEGHD